MSNQAKIVGVYVVIGTLSTLRGWLFGENSDKGFAYNLDLGLAWPVILFSGLGKFIGTAIIAGLIVLMLAS